MFLFTKKHFGGKIEISIRKHPPGVPVRHENIASNKESRYLI